MNARQKAKKYKHMYEALIKQPVRFKMERHRIDTLRFERFYPYKEIIDKDSDLIRELIVGDIAEELASSLGKYIDYHTEFCPDIHKYRFYGEIKVVHKL